MKKPRVFIITAVSIDGYIAKHADEPTNWTSLEDKQHFAAQTKQAGVVIMGNATFNTLSRPLSNRLNVIYTKSPENLQATENVMPTNSSPEELVTQLQNKGFSNIAIIGGKQINSLFLQADLVDELYVTIEPRIFGSGIPLAELTREVDLILLQQTLLNKNSLLLHFAVKP